MERCRSGLDNRLLQSEFYFFENLLAIAFRAGVSNSICSVGQMRTYKVTRGPHYDTNATMALPQPYKKQLLHLISCERYRE